MRMRWVRGIRRHGALGFCRGDVGSVDGGFWCAARRRITGTRSIWSLEENALEVLQLGFVVRDAVSLLLTWRSMAEKGEREGVGWSYCMWIGKRRRGGWDSGGRV